MGGKPKQTSSGGRGKATASSSGGSGKAGSRSMSLRDRIAEKRTLTQATAKKTSAKATPVTTRSPKKTSAQATLVTTSSPKKTSAKATTKQSSAKVAAKSKGKARRSSKSSASKQERRKSAYSLFSAECRGEVLKAEKIEDVPQNFGEASKALARSWSEVDAETKQKFEARAKIDQHRGKLQSFSRQAHLYGEAEKVASEVRHSIKAFGKLPRSERAGELVAGVITAMEALDRKLSQDLKAAVGTSVGDRLPSAEAAQNFRKALGTELGDRLVTLLQRWHTAAAAVGKPRAAPAGGRTPARSAKRRQAATSPSAAPVRDSGDVGEVDNLTRTKVVGIMMKTSARGSGKAALQQCRDIEEELFKLYGLMPKEYFRRARSLRFNLGAADGALLQRVQAGELSPAELVKMSAEDLAPEALREQREREREHYFKTQVHLTGSLRKRRRSDYGSAKERLADSTFNLDDPQALARRGSFAGESQADMASQEVQIEQPALTEDSRQSAARQTGSGSDSESDSSSSGSSSSSSSVVDIEGELAALLEQDPVPLPGLAPGDQNHAVSTANDLAIVKVLQEVSSASSSSGSSDSSSEENEADPQANMASMAEGRAQLWAMGFSTEVADAALLRTKGNVERAVAMLLKKPA